MKIKNINIVKGATSRVHDCEVGDGYLKTSHGSLADVDIDFSADRREEVKHYLEQRYDTKTQSRVFSAGALTQIKAKSAMKDVAATHKIPRSTVNYLTQIIEDDELTWSNLMRLGAKDKRIGKFIQDNYEVFEEMLPILNQGRSNTIHPSAVIVTPEFVNGERVNCYDILPVKKQNDMLVSELNGVEIDAIGILKNDILSIRELERLSMMLELIAKEYGVTYTMLQIVNQFIDDEKVFALLSKGFTQGVFQLSNSGMTKFVKRLQPSCIHDLIAAVALFRPGPLDSGAAENYIRAKRGEYEPEYLWNTYEILKDTYAQCVYQEQISRVAQVVGGLSLGDGVNLVKALSKKKIDKVRKFQSKFFEDAQKNGCPIDAAKKIWSIVEDAAKYAFNLSHATAYGLTSYCGAWLKTYYPTAFYTVVLRDQDEDKMAVLMNEIESVGNTKLEKPDINISGETFVPDFKNNIIYWSLSRIKQLGPKAVRYIIQERNLYGQFHDMEDFIKRIFKHKFKNFDDEGTDEIRERCPVTALCVKNLIFAGAFDACEHVESVMGRYVLLQRAAKLLGFELREKDVPEDMKDKHYYWSRKQIELSGHGAIDYKRILESINRPMSVQNAKFIDFKDLNSLFSDAKRGVICATILSITDKTYKDKRTGETKHFGKIELQQNTETNILTIWTDWPELKPKLKSAAGRIVAAMVNAEWSDFDEKKTLRIGKNSFLELV